MFPDKVLETLADNKGLFGVEVAGFGVRTEKHPEGNIEGYMEHLEYCIELMGIDHVGCGPDSMYGDHVGQYRIYRERYRTEGYGHYQRPDRQTTRPQSQPIEYVRGMENPSECLKNVTRSLIKNGYSDEEISKVIGKNALRLLRKVWH
jgi:membrane dipeptidase